MEVCFAVATFELFAISDLAESARSGRSKCEFSLLIFVPFWYQIGYLYSSASQ